MKNQGDSPPKRPKRNTEIRGERGWGEKRRPAQAPDGRPVQEGEEFDG